MFQLLFFWFIGYNDHYYRQRFENNGKEVKVDSENFERVSEIQ